MVGLGCLYASQISGEGASYTARIRTPFLTLNCIFPTAISLIRYGVTEASWGMDDKTAVITAYFVSCLRCSGIHPESQRDSEEVQHLITNAGCEFKEQGSCQAP